MFYRLLTKFSLLLIVILTIIAYLPSFSAPFVFDDIAGITQNPYIKNLFAAERIWKASGSRFLPNLSLAINYFIGGLRTFDYHLVNLLIHLINTIVVYYLVKSILNKQTIPSIAAAIFALHPIQTQAVTYVIQRYASLAALFYLLTLFFFIRARLNNTRLSTFYYLLSLTTSASAFLSRESSFSLPAAIFLVDAFFFQQEKKGLKNKLFYIAPFFVIAFWIYFVTRTSFLADFKFSASQLLVHPTYIHKVDIAIGDYLLTQINVVATYIRLLFIPINQNIDYDYPITSVFNLPTLLSLVLHVSLILMSFVAYRRQRLISFGILFFYLALLLESSIFPISDVITEHRLYLPMLGFALVISAILVSIKTRYLFTVFCLLFISFLALLTFRRNLIWSNPVSLWQDTVRKSPQKARPHAALAEAYTNVGLFDQAILEYEKAIQIDPKRSHAHYNNIGMVYLRQKKLDQAKEFFQKAITSDPSDFYARNNLGGVYVEQGKIKEAILEFEKVLEIAPKDLNALKNLGIIYLRLAEKDEALTYYRAAVEANKDNDIAHSELGEVYRMFGKNDLAMEEFKKALDINPRNTQAKKGLGSLQK